MLKLILILLVSNAIGDTLAANLISRGSVTGRLTNNGLSSTIIKSQLNTVDTQPEQQQQQQQRPQKQENQLDNDDAHFRLYYKSNSPGRSVKHELEHRFYKNPNFLALNQEEASAPMPQFFYQTLPTEMPAAVPSYQAAQYAPNADNQQSAMLNLHYHDNGDFASQQLLQQQQQVQQQLQQQMSYNQFVQPSQEQQQEQQLRFNVEKQRSFEQFQQSRRDQLLKLMLMNFMQKASPVAATVPLASSLDNGVQYKIVNLKFRIEPQHGSK